MPNETREMADLACTRRDGRVPETYQPLGEFDFECHERYAKLLGFGKRREESVAPAVNIDGRTIGTGRPGPMVAKLRGLYLDRIERETGQL